jgi:hypothetical protein
LDLAHLQLFLLLAVAEGHRDERAGAGHDHRGNDRGERVQGGPVETADARSEIVELTLYLLERGLEA